MAHCSFCEMSEEQAREEERERIIKELQDHPYRLNNGMFCACGSPVNYWIHVQNIVKGEK